MSNYYVDLHKCSSNVYNAARDSKYCFSHTSLSTFENTYFYLNSELLMYSVK